jgi:hypothetical protein
MVEWLKRRSLTELLGYAGLLPFAGALVGTVFGFASAVAFFISYSAMILVFMSGACWGVAQARDGDFNKRSLGISIGIFWLAMGAWLLSAIIPDEVTLPLLMSGFLGLYALETTSLFQSSYSSQYWRLRTVLTSVVVVSHVLMFLLIPVG